MFHFWINTFFVDMHVMQQEAEYAEVDRYTMYINNMCFGCIERIRVLILLGQLASY